MMFQTIAYKNGWIHISYSAGKETVAAQLPDLALTHCKSVFAAKLFITRYGGLK